MKRMKLPRPYGRGIFSPRFVGMGIPPKRKHLRFHPRAYARGISRRGIILVLLVSLEFWLSAIIVRHVYQVAQEGQMSKFATGIARLARSSFAVSQNGPVDGYYEPIPFHKELQPPESWMREPVTYTINSDSLNSRYDFTVDKPSHTFRIVTLGDSFTFGMYVNTYENYSERLEDMLSGAPCASSRTFDVINLGVPGYDIEFETVRYNLRGRKYRPDLLIWYIEGNDFMERAAFVSSYNTQVVKEKEDMGFGGIALQHAVVSAVSEEVAKRYGGEANIASYQLDKLQAFLDSLGDTKVLILLDNRLGVWYRDKITSIVRALPNVSMLPLSAIDRLPDTHPSSLGHQEIASQIFFYLIRSQIIYGCVH